jgi:sugar lactone lactonase YvrE
VTPIPDAVALFLDAHAELGEGPVWDPIAGCLSFVDILRGLVHRVEPASRRWETFRVGRMVGAAVPTDAGDLLLAVKGGFARLDIRTGVVQAFADLADDRADIRMNDGKCDPAGRFWAGTMALDERSGAGHLYRLDPDGRIHTMLGGVSISNGLDWSEDGRLMYFIDSPTGSIDVLDYDAASGAIANRRSLVRIPREEGLPDGMTLDADGHLWVALWGGGAVHRYAPDGSRDAVVNLPTRYPTSCTFGGADLRDLFITTASIAIADSDRAGQPLAGAVFVARPGVLGRPPHRFKG